MKTPLKNAYKSFLGQINSENALSVSLTMKQRVGFEKLDAINASQNFRHFMNILNCSVYGNAFKRYQKRLGVAPVLENSSSDRLHYHLVLERPTFITLSEFNDLIVSSWGKTKFGYTQIDIQNIYSDGWIDYITKFKFPDDEFDIFNFQKIK